tara:strand:+ start:308 stop:1036 length:729 start_codon:yes stop_codon:yes gene_type:complete
MPAVSKLPFIAWLMLFGTLSVSTASAEPADGKAIYQKCINCHGQNAQGVKRFRAPGLAGLQAEYIERQLKNFFNITRGYAYKDVGGHRMRPMARMLKKGQSTEMSPDMMKAVSTYLSELPTKVQPQTLVNGDSDRGGIIYRKVCKTCHGADAAGMAGLGPDLRYTGDWYLFTQLKNFKGKRRAGRDDPACKGDFPPEKCDPQGMSMVKVVWPEGQPSLLPDEQAMKDVIAYVMRLARSKAEN